MGVTPTPETRISTSPAPVGAFGRNISSDDEPITVTINHEGVDYEIVTTRRQMRSVDEHNRRVLSGIGQILIGLIPGIGDAQDIIILNDPDAAPC